MKEQYCSTCNCQYPQDQLNEANDFDEKGKLRILFVCQQCEKEFDELEISFNFRKTAAQTAENLSEYAKMKGWLSRDK